MHNPSASGAFSERVLLLQSGTELGLAWVWLLWGCPSWKGQGRAGCAAGEQRSDCSPG